MTSFLELVAALNRAAVRYVVIGVAGVNYHAVSARTSFNTRDRDLFLPLDPDNELAAWKAATDLGLELWAGAEPLDRPRDRWLAEQIVARQALVTARDGKGLEVDFTLIMTGLEFEAVWRERRIYRVDDVDIHVARLSHIVASKAAAGRPKDRLFLATHEEALQRLAALDREPNRGDPGPE